MGNKLRAILLLTLLLAAIFAAHAAYRSVRPYPPDTLSAAVYRGLLQNAQQAQYLLRDQAGYVAIFPNLRGAAATQTTHIALSTLRSLDRAMLRRGIPVADRRSLLLLLEDLGS